MNTYQSSLKQGLYPPWLADDVLCEHQKWTPNSVMWNKRFENHVN